MIRGVFLHFFTMYSLRIFLSVLFLFIFATSVSAETEHDDDHEARQGVVTRHTDSSEKHTVSTKKKKVLKPTKILVPKPTPKPKSSTGTTQSPSSSQNSTVSYNTPEGMVSVGFSVTIKNGVITSASSTKKAGGTSWYYQDSFASGLTQSVVGKKAAGLYLSAIGGASLTTGAFERFIAGVK